MVESDKRFPYHCEWECGRQNVVSKIGNSCGRANLNAALRVSEAADKGVSLS